MSVKRLILMRHAKSSWSTGAIDHQRPLNKRGRKDAPRIATNIVDHGWMPDLVVSSDSMRTRETWEGMSSVMGAVPTQFLNSLYLGGSRAFEAAVERIAADVTTVLVLGHNPGWEEIGGILTGQYIQMTTANAILMEKTASDWVGAIHEGGLWRVEAVFRPREPRPIPR